MSARPGSPIVAQDDFRDALAAGACQEQADALVRSIRALGGAALRAGYVAGVARSWPLESFARALDALCQRAEQAERLSREALIAVVDALNAESMDELVLRLREQAAGESLLALERLLRHPARLRRSEPPRAPAPSKPMSTQSGGRPLTLGERKSLARRPDRELMQRLLADPHPDVVRRCLGNPRLTEDDVIPLAAKRPGRAAVLAEVARSPWVHRRRVRMALVLNPSTPPEIAARIAGLLLRPELDQVARSPRVPPFVRALCLEHLARRPPVHAEPQGDVH